MIRSLTALILTTLTLTACSTSGCLDNQSALPLAGFYSEATGDAIDVTNLTVRGVGAPLDSALLRNTTAGQVYLPFRASQPSTTYIFTADGVDDEVTFTYSSIPYFASEECGAMYRYRITGVQHTDAFIDSVAVTDSLITNVNLEQIRIYFRTIDQQ